MEDLFFIHNINDYIKYSNLKPKKLYNRKKVKFICSKCNKESIKTFRYLNKDLICRACTCKDVQNTIEVKNKIKETNNKKYGVDNVFQSQLIKEKVKSTNLIKYGTENPHQNESVINKTKQTNLEKYGVEVPALNNDIVLKMQATTLERYGVNNAMQNDEIKLKYKTSIQGNWLIHYNRLIKEYNIELIKPVENGFIEAKCNKCNGIFSISESVFYSRLRNHTCYCPLCTLKTHVIKSNKEQELYRYIKDIYHGLIVTNDRKVLNGKEIDIYLPSLKLGFEFDGTYWHADPRFFNENDLIMNKTAYDIWEKDRLKDILAENIGIKLIHIKEEDWLNNKNKVIELIKNEIFN